MLPANCPDCGEILTDRNNFDRPSMQCPRCGCLILNRDDKRQFARDERDRPQGSAPVPGRRKPGPPRRRRKPRTLLVLAIVFASVLFICAGGGTFVWYVFIHEIDEPVTAADKEVMITGEYVGTFSDTLEIDPKKGVFSKVRHLDGCREISYEYDKPENTDEPLYVTHTVTIERNAKEAREAFAGMQLASKLGLGKADDVQEVERNDLWSWGDRSRCIMLHSKGQPFGQMFMGLKGRRYFVLVISGLYFTKKDDIKAFLDPMLKKLDGYDG